MEREERRPAEVFSPVEYIKEEMASRGWSRVGMAVEMGMPKVVVDDLLDGIIPVTPGIAKQLASAFGATAQMWLNLQSTYDKGTVRVAADIPKKPANIEQHAPLTNAAAVSHPIFHPSNRNTMTMKIASILYSCFKKTIAPR